MPTELADGLGLRGAPLTTKNEPRLKSCHLIKRHSRTFTLYLLKDTPRILVPPLYLCLMLVVDVTSVWQHLHRQI